jgi:hypothetical protein
VSDEHQQTARLAAVPNEPRQAPSGPPQPPTPSALPQSPPGAAQSPPGAAQSPAPAPAVPQPPAPPKGAPKPVAPPVGPPRFPFPGRRKGDASSPKPKPQTPEDAAKEAERKEEESAELITQRDRLLEKFTVMQADLGGAFYEMAIRDHVRLDVLTRKAAELQRVDAELLAVERVLELERADATGLCPSCGAPHGPAVRFCPQCGTPLVPTGAGA